MNIDDYRLTEQYQIDKDTIAILTAKLVAADKRNGELADLLKQCRKVMKADALHRGNPDRRVLWQKITAALDAAREG